MRRLWWVGPLVAVLAIGSVVAEIALLVWVSDLIGFWPTLGLVVLSTFVGVFLTRREGAKAWQALTQSVTSGRLPTGPLADGALILLGGLLLIAPGFLSDAVGLLLLLPVTRPLVRSALGFVAGHSAQRRPGTPTIIEGDIVEEQQPPTIRGELAD